MSILRVIQRADDTWVCEDGTECTVFASYSDVMNWVGNSPYILQLLFPVKPLQGFYKVGCDKKEGSDIKE